tara:strand:- start:3020 stop:3544 length:525 start_codon:yes stop_codon:yes gene_type:complete
MKLPGSLIKKRANDAEKRKQTAITHVVVDQTTNMAQLPSPVCSPTRSPVSMSSAPVERQFVDNKPEEIKKIAPPPAVDILMNKLDELEKRQTSEKVVTPPPAVSDNKESVVTPVIELTAQVKPALTETHLTKLSKPELMSLCSAHKVYVKLPATRKVLIASILENQKSSDNRNN